MLESTALKTALLFLGFAAAVYLCLIRERRWRVDDYGPRRARRHFLGCLLIGLAIAGATLFAFHSEIVCPAGYGAPDTRSVQRQHKSGIQIVCHANDDGRERDGSMASAVFAFLGLWVVAFAGTSAVWRAISPPAPGSGPGAASASPASPASLAPPKDRRARRRARKREAHRNRQG